MKTAAVKFEAALAAFVDSGKRDSQTLTDDQLNVIAMFSIGCRTLARDAAPDFLCLNGCTSHVLVFSCLLLIYSYI